ncbi:hypothetical protein [Methylobacterium sp. A54F]
MRNPALSLWLSGANRAAGWWMGHATAQASAAMRRQQRAALAAMTKAGPAKAGKPKRRPRRKATRRTP